MAKREIEPKTIWTCDRCGVEVERPQSHVMPMYWRHWSLSDERRMLLKELDVCPPCSNIITLAGEQ